MTTEAKKTEVYLFIDGPKTNDDAKTQELIKNHANSNKKYFAALNIHHHIKNIGLRKNITQAIDYVFKKNEAVIVLEDDVVVSSSFLTFMNKALSTYSKNFKVWHINGFSNLENRKKLKEVYMTRFMNCWGWATWKNRWRYYERDINKLATELNFLDRAYLSLFGLSNHWRQIRDNKIGRIDTWAVFWHAAIARKKGMCVTPWFSYTKNIGLDGSGTNCPEERDNKNNEMNNCDNPNLIFDKKESKSALILLAIVFIGNILKSIRRKIPI